MNDYPIVIVGYTLRNVQELCRTFAKSNPIHSVERKGQAKYKFLSNGKEYWIMHQNDYVQWCKGRTYYESGRLMHSGREIKEQK